MARKTFLFWLLSADKKPLYVDDATGHVLEADGATFKKPDNQPAYLKDDPTGWKDTLVKYARNNKYLGVFRDMTVPMKFTKNAAKVLRNRMWLFGIECLCYLAIHKLDRLNFPYNYESWYSCEIDFSKFKQTNNDFTVNAMEGGPGKYLKAFETTVYEIPISTNPNKKVVYLDGVPFTNTVTYTIYENQDITGEFYYIGAGITATEGTTQGVDSQASLYSYTTNAGDNWLFRSITKNVVAKIKGQLRIKINVTGSTQLLFKRCSPFQSIPTTVVDFSFHNQVHTAGEIITIPFDLSIPINPNEFLTLRAFPNFVSSATNWYTILDGSFTLQYDVTFAPTFAECLTPFTLGQEIVSKLTDGKYNLKSSFLESLKDDLLLTSGPALRKYQSVSSIKSSIKSFFKSLQRYGIGLGIEGDFIVIEKHDYFFRKDVVITLPTINNYEVVAAEDLIINTIKAGYPNQEIDKINGRDEVNVTQQYTTPLTRIVTELDLVSDYRADMYGIEATRNDLTGQDTTDNTADNDVFMISTTKGADYIYYSGDFETVVSGGYFIKISGTWPTLANGTKIIIAGAASNNGTYTILNTSYLIVGYTYIQVAEVLTNATLNGALTGSNADWYKLKRLAYTSTSGVLHPDLGYNYDLSPKISVLNNGPYIHSILDYQDLKSVVFQSGDKNSSFSRTYNGVTITEDADIPIGALGPKLFLPYYFTITTNVPFDLLKKMEANRYSLVQFPIKGVNYYGYMWDGGIKPGTNDVQQWKLLAAANNDMSKLIENA